MKRREVLKKATFAAGALFTGPYTAPAAAFDRNRKRILRIAHITDVHIRPEYDAPSRFRKCLSAIKKHQPDFFLNGGDTIYAADYDHITQDRVSEQWTIWKNCIQDIRDFELYSCLGNHDMWWAAPDKQHEMYGKNYVVRQLGMPGRYYSFDRNGWRFIVLDSNNANAGAIDTEQRIWLEKELESLAPGSPVLLMSHYPLLAACTHLAGGGMHTDYKYLVGLFYRHRDKIKACISGHIHLLDQIEYNNIRYYCNGAMSGFWWEEGDRDSAGKYYYLQTPPGYAIIDLFSDGTVENSYHPHDY